MTRVSRSSSEPSSRHFLRVSMACFLLACIGRNQVMALFQLPMGLPVTSFSLHDWKGMLAWKAVTSFSSFSGSFVCRKSSKQMCLTITSAWLIPSNALQSVVFPAPGRPHVTARQTLAFTSPPSAAEVIYTATWLSAEEAVQDAALP